MRAAAAGAITFVVLAGTAGPVAGQSCGLAAAGAIRTEAGVVNYDIGDGLMGISVGGDIEGVLARNDGLEIRVGYRTFLFSDGPSPHVGRFAAAFPLPLPRIGGFGLCLTGHAGGSWLPTDQGDVSAVAAGAGLRLAYPIGEGGLMTVPFIEARGLVGSSAGDLAGIGVDARAQSVGVVAGLSSRLGWALIRVAGSMDGLPTGLGITPYPRWSGHVSIGIPF